MTERVNDGILRIIIPVLALADGTIHLLLDFVLFRGRLIGSPFPSGARPRVVPGRVAPRPRAVDLSFLPPLNELFLLNFIGAIVLTGLFLYATRWPAARRVWVDVLMIAYAAVTFVAWWLFGRPNPMGLGFLSKGIEIALIIALIVHIRILLPARRVAESAPESGSLGS
jgi:hypothetical protein